MTPIFISYRREDSAGQAGRLFDHLVEQFGEDGVFMDVDTIDLGRDFKPALQQAVRKCDVMLVVVGPSWLDVVDQASGVRRLDNANDWVRLEIAEALKRDVSVIPVLVRGALRPAADRLPLDIRGLADRQAISISDSQWRAGVSDLIERLEAIPRRREREVAATWIARVGFRRLVVSAGAAAAVLIAAGWWLWPTSVEVPAVIGKSLADAQAGIGAAGLELQDGRPQEEESSSGVPGTVIRQDPSPGLRLPKGQAVRIVLAKVPPAVDLSNGVEIRQMGNEGTIAAVAAVAAIETAFAQSGRRAHLSERYLYEKAKRHDESTGGDGTWMTAIIYVAEQFGAPPYDLWPYIPKVRSLPKNRTWEQVDAAAADHKARFHPLTGLDQIYASLRIGRPVLATVSIGPEWGTDAAWKTGKITVAASRSESEDQLGVVTVVGADPAARTFRFAHSWGQDWGANGFGTMSFDTARILLNPKAMWAVEALATP